MWTADDDPDDGGEAAADAAGVPQQPIPGGETPSPGLPGPRHHQAAAAASAPAAYAGEAPPPTPTGDEAAAAAGNAMGVWEEKFRIRDEAARAAAAGRQGDGCSDGRRLHGGTSLAGGVHAGCCGARLPGR